MDPHGIAEARSLAFHRVVAARLAGEPALLDRAGSRVRAWLAATPDAHYARAWQQVLQRPAAEVVAFLVTQDDDIVVIGGQAARAARDAGV
jgi:hypothetical protein